MTAAAHGRLPYPGGCGNQSVPVAAPARRHAVWSDIEQYYDV
jgi:hypothetical protein